MLRKKESSVKKAAAFALLHAIIFLYAIADVLSKYASQKDFLSWPFILLYGGVLLILVVYALLWQQVLKILPLITAYVNKSMTIIWGLIFGMALFNEHISFGKIIGMLLVIGGVIIVVMEDEKA